MKSPKRSENNHIGVLVVEDSPTQAAQLKFVLEEHGYVVTVATNGREALAALPTCRPAVIVSDVVMPEMDGYALCKEIKSREELRNTPVILLTSLSGPEDVIRGLQCGADNFICKPYEERYLLSRIEYVLANRALRRREHLQMGVEVYLGGERHFITAERQQILDLLISSYEEAVRINAELKQRQGELDRSLLTVKGLHRMAETLNACRRGQEVLDTALERALELPGVQAGWISLREGETGFRLAAARGLPPALEALGAMEGDCQCRRRLLAGELDRVTNILECERLQKAKGDVRGLRFHASVPLWSGDRVVGVMNLAGAEQGMFREEDLKTLYGVGSQIAVAIERAQLLEQLERKVEERTAALTAEMAERERAEKAVRQSEARYRGLFERATYGICQVRLDGTFIDVNPALVQMLGYGSKEELLGRSMATDIFCDPNVRVSVIGQAQRAEVVPDVDVEWKRKDGARITVRTSGRTVYDERGHLLHFEVIAEDVTEHRILEKQNRQLQKFEAIGQLAGGIAHDFNNVIGVILGWAELGLEETPKANPAYSRFQKIHDQAKRCTTLVARLLAFARRQILETRNLDLNEAVQAVAGLLEKTIGAHIQLKTLLASDLHVTRADPTQIEQVLMNLCLNARDAMPQGGQLAIETQNVEFDEAYCRLHSYARPGHYVQLAVSDTGVGMDAETIDHIFEPFFTTKEIGKGTGLGLAMVYGIVKQHGGFLHVYSEPGHGSTFRAYLPVSTGPAEVHEQPKSTPVRGGTETILVAEDHDGGREIVKEVLEKLGYSVLLAADGEEAVKLFESHRDRIDLVILDVVMPKMGGPAAYAQMSAVEPGLLVLFATGYSKELNQLKGLLERGAEIIQKPYGPTALGRRVREVLDGAR